MGFVPFFPYCGLRPQTITPRLRSRFDFSQLATIARRQYKGFLEEFHGLPGRLPARQAKTLPKVP
jgi:hypothetical protein